jgi:hypothetical protein
MARPHSQAGCQGPLRIQRRDVGALAAGEAVHPAWRPGSVEDEFHRDGSLSDLDTALAAIATIMMESVMRLR